MKTTTERGLTLPHSKALAEKFEQLRAELAPAVVAAPAKVAAPVKAPAVVTKPTGAAALKSTLAEMLQRRRG